MSFIQRLFAVSALALFACFASTFAQMANVQIIHNSSDPAAAIVDIYINDNKSLDDFAYRSASPFVPIPAGFEIIAKIAASDSENADDKIIATISLGALEDGQNYVIVANGVLGENFNNGGDESRNIDFNLYTVGNARQLSSGGAGFVDVAVFHGVTDAPAVDIFIDIAGEPLFRNVEYGQFSEYVSLPASDEYIFTVTEAGNPEAVLDRFLAPLKTADRAAAVICATGFATPGDEPGMPSAEDYAFGLLVPFPFGGQVLLPNDIARVQIVHNSSMEAADKVDIYVNGLKPEILDDLEYRSATRFIDVPAGIDVTVVIAQSTSTAVDQDVLATVELGELVSGQSYVAVANGIIGTEGFNNPDPDNRSIILDLYLLPGQETNDVEDEVAANFFHGVTDAPAIDVYGEEVDEAIFSNLDYAEQTGYLTFDNFDTAIEVTEADNPGNVLGVFNLPFADFGGQGVTIISSGFQTPGDEEITDNGTYDFKLLLIEPSGFVDILDAELPEPTAQVQVIHNSSLPAAATVDIYINGEKSAILDDFAYRTATPFLELPAEVELTIVIAAANSTGVDDQVLDTFDGQLSADNAYVLIANGTPGEGWNNGGDANRNIDLELFTLGGRTEAMSNSDLDIMVFHGVTDAPAVDIYTDFSAASPTIGGLDYGIATDYITVPAAPLNLFLTAAGSKETYVGGYQFFLTNLAGESAVVLATGFLSPEDEPGPPPAGYEFGLIAVLADGTILTPSVVSSVSEEAREIESASVKITPNPVSERAELSFVMSETAEVRVFLTDARGATVTDFNAGILPVGQHNMTLPIQNLASGAYNVIIMTATGAQQTQLNLVR